MVTVLMPVRDTPAGMLRQASESIRRQTYPDFEFLILDDGSRDPETLGELDRQAAAEPRIRLHRGPGAGLTKTLNWGLELATREFIARQDADDWSEPRRLEMQLDFLRVRPHLNVCGSNAWTHRHDGRPLWPTRLPLAASEIREAFWRQNPFVHGATLFRAEAARAVGGYREEFPCAQDYDFFWRLADAGGGANLAEPLYHYRYSAGSVSVHRAAEQARAHRAAQILARSRKESGTHPRTREEIRHALDQAKRALETSDGNLRALLKQADHRMLAGDTWGACRSYLDLLKFHPASALAWGKLARWAVYSALPPAREMCFR